MKKKSVVRKYRFSDAHLKQFADKVLFLLDRDITEFNDRGFSPAKRSDFVLCIDVFENTPSDEQVEGMKITATEDKDNARLAVEKSMRTIFLMAKNVFKEGSGKYKEFGNTDLSRQIDEELVRNAKMTETTANKYLVDLTDEGLTAAKLSLFKTAIITLDTAIDLQFKAISERDTATESRIEAGNTLYDWITKYAEIGKDIWYETNEAKYNDYVIYNTSSGAAEAIQTNDAA